MVSINEADTTIPFAAITFTEVDVEEFELEEVIEDDYDYIYTGTGIIILIIDWYAPRLFEVVLYLDGRMIKSWYDGIFENDTKEFNWDTSQEDNNKIYEWRVAIFDYSADRITDAFVKIKINRPRAFPVLYFTLAFFTVCAFAIISVHLFQKRSR